MSVLESRAARLLAIVLCWSVVLQPTPSAAQTPGWTNTALSWGFNAWGELGDGTYTPRRTPAVIPSLGSNVTMVAAGRDFGVALRDDGSVWTWGANTQGQLGDGSAGRPTPLPVPDLPPIVGISAGLAHVLALAADGTVWAWGANDRHQVAESVDDVVAVPTLVPGVVGIQQVAAGDDFSLALEAQGTVWAWGQNDVAQLGTGDTGFYTRPVPVADLTAVVRIAAGSQGSLALRNDNSLWTWGRYLALLNQRPRQVTGLPWPVASIAAGGGSFFCVCGTLSDVWAWGNNADGRLGDGTTISYSVPARVPNLTGVYDIFAAGGHTAAMKIDGTLWTWGQNQYGELGVGSTAPFVPSPSQVPGVASTTHVTLGRKHILAVASQPPVVQLPGSRTDRVGQFLSLTISASGGVPPYSWSASGLPPGLSLHPLTAVLSGTPTVAGGYTVQVRATDAIGHVGVGVLHWSIVVTQAVPSLYGMSQIGARNALLAVGLTLGHVAKGHGCNGPYGTVVGQSPGAGAHVPPGSAVNITVEAGPLPGHECP